MRQAIYRMIRRMAFRRWDGLYYWAELRLMEAVWRPLLPTWYYRALFRVSMKMVDWANKAIHTIPYHIRFQ